MKLSVTKIYLAGAVVAMLCIVFVLIFINTKSAFNEDHRPSPQSIELFKGRFMIDGHEYIGEVVDTNFEGTISRTVYVSSANNQLPSIYAQDNDADGLFEIVAQEPADPIGQAIFQSLEKQSTDSTTCPPTITGARPLQRAYTFGHQLTDAELNEQERETLKSSGWRILSETRTSDKMILNLCLQKVHTAMVQVHNETYQIFRWKNHEKFGAMFRFD